MDRLEVRKKQFIKRAIAAHGDRYDYSQVEFTSGKHVNITIICPDHGAFIQEAGTHLRKRKGREGFMGCRKCGDLLRVKPRLCSDCGVQMPFGRGASQIKRCQGCKASRKKPQPKCKACDRPAAPFRSYCSNECRAEMFRLRHLPKPCEKCGELFSTKGKSVAQRFCSLQCQRAFALKDNHSARKLRSKSAKRRYRKAESRRRKETSAGYKWWRLCNRKYGIQKPAEPWRRRCSAAISSVRNRLERTKKKRNKREFSTWEEAAKIREQNARTVWKRQEKFSCLWERKCASVASNARKRSKRKSQRKQDRESGRITSVKAEQLMLFDYLD